MKPVELTDEEKDAFLAEGLPIPTTWPLTKVGKISKGEGSPKLTLQGGGKDHEGCETKNSKQSQFSHRQLFFEQCIIFISSRPARRQVGKRRKSTSTRWKEG